MALKGTLKSFPPSELLQFLTNSGKTGTLQVYDDQESKLIAFENGQLYYAVHQRRMPDLRELCVHRGWASPDDLPAEERSRHEWDDVVSRALARRRDLDGRASGDERRAQLMRPRGQTRLGAILLAQHSITEHQLEAALQPETIPDGMLETLLRSSDLVPKDTLDEVRQGLGEEESLLAALRARELIDDETLATTLHRISDEALAELLVHHGAIGRAEARHILEQFEALRQRTMPQIRLGRLLVAKGTISQRQLERVREAQIKDGRLIGEVLVEQGMLSREDLEVSLAEKKALVAEFGPLCSLRRRLETWHGISPHEFDEALRLCWEPGSENIDVSDRALVDFIEDTKGIPTPEVYAMVRDILLEELCDLLTWEEASFEFFEGFSLQDALPDSPMPRVHTLNIDVQAMLLAAHSEIDELRRTEFGAISMHSVFLVEPTTADVEQRLSATDKYAADELNILLRCDGEHSVREVCRVLPGSPFAHVRLCGELMEVGLLAPISRADAHSVGEAMHIRGRHGRAAVLLTHALEAPGDDPTDAELRTALQHAQWHNEERLVQRVVIGWMRLWRSFTEIPVIAKTAEKVGTWGWWTRLHSRARTAIRGLPAAARRWHFSFEQFMIRRGWARQWWAVKSRMFTPVRQLMERPNTRKMVSIGVPAVVILALLLPGTPADLPDPTPPQMNVIEEPLALARSLGVVTAGAPIEGTPVHRDDHVYFTARDGNLHAMRVDAASSGGLSEAWSVALGEIGDITSSPTLAGDHLFVTNVRGHVFCVSLEGEVVWKTTFVRLERIAPTAVRDAEGEVDGIAVISFEEVHVLDPANGKPLYRLRTGNRIVTPPTAHAGILFVGSSDNHVYAANWRSGEILWQRDVGADVDVTHHHGDKLLYGTQPGRVGALDAATGRSLWSSAFERGAIRSIQRVDESLVFVEMTRGRGRIIALEDGSVVDELTLPRNLQPEHVRHCADGYYYVSRRGHLGHVNAAGTHLWSTPEGLGEVSGWAMESGLILVSTRGGELEVLTPPAQGDTP